jgi:hypothetical protein
MSTLELLTAAFFALIGITIIVVMLVVPLTYWLVVPALICFFVAYVLSG